MTNGSHESEKLADLMERVSRLERTADALAGVTFSAEDAAMVKEGIAILIGIKSLTQLARIAYAVIKYIGFFVAAWLAYKGLFEGKISGWSFTP